MGWALGSWVPEAEVGVVERGALGADGDFVGSMGSEDRTVVSLLL